MHFNSLQLLFISVMGAGIGYTLLNYSQDGDLENRLRHKSKYSDSKTPEKEAWDHLVLLTNSNVMEVTWNTTLFVAFISSLVFLSLLEFHKQSYNPIILWFLSLFTVFGLQDTIIRWKNAHRKHPLVAEQLAIIERLRYSKSSLRSHS